MTWCSGFCVVLWFWWFSCLGLHSPPAKLAKAGPWKTILLKGACLLGREGSTVLWMNPRLTLSRSPSSALLPFLGEGSLTKIDCKKNWVPTYSKPSTGGPSIVCSHDGDSFWCFLGVPGQFWLDLMFCGLAFLSVSVRGLNRLCFTTSG